MVIHAAAAFTCAHGYVATQVGNRVLFVCQYCQHRSELLPLARCATVRTVFPFSSSSRHLLHSFPRRVATQKAQP